MIRCPKCNKELSDSASFCDRCGTRFFKAVVCPKCGKKIRADLQVCPSCGAYIEEKPAVNRSSEAPVTKKKLPPKAIIFGGIGIAAIVLLIIIIAMVSGSSGKNKKNENIYALYWKDDEIYYNNLKVNSDALQVSSRLCDSYDINEHYLEKYMYLSEDGKYIFFPDKVGNDKKINLYYRAVGQPDSEASKIDSDIRLYSVNAYATAVTYIKGDEGNLYQYSIREDSKEKISGEVETFWVNDDGTKILYTTTDGNIYLKCAEKDKEKIASNVTRIEYVSDDFKTVCYTKDLSLYRQIEGKDKEKIASYVCAVDVYDSESIYYLKLHPLMDYVIDDMEEADALITEPDYPDYPDYPLRVDFDTEAEYNAAYDAYLEEYEQMSAEYDAAYESYCAKVRRDNLRKSLENRYSGSLTCSLCFFDGTEETVITDSFYGSGWEDNNMQGPGDALVIACETYDLEKIKLSEVESVYDVESKLRESMYDSMQLCVVVKKTATVIELENGYSDVWINGSGTMICYIDGISEEYGYGDLYSISIVDGVVGKPELCDSDVDVDTSGYFINDRKYFYFKDSQGNKGDLYINKNKIDYDVYDYRVTADNSSGKVYYYTDWDFDKGYGTLKVYQNGKAVKISDDVYDYTVTADGRVLYLYDYSLKYKQGELYEWNNGETRKIDDDVQSIITNVDYKYRGY